MSRNSIANANSLTSWHQSGPSWRRDERNVSRQAARITGRPGGAHDARGGRGRGRQPQHGLANDERRPEGRPRARREGQRRRRDARLPPRRDGDDLRRADRLSASIGLVFDDVANPFHATLHRGDRDVARARGVLAFAGSSDEDAERERDLVQAFLSRRVDGLGSSSPPGRDHGYLLRDRDAGVALVFVDRPPGFIEADVVPSDHAAARARRPPTCSPPGTGGSATSATGAASKRGRAPARAHRGPRAPRRPVRSRARPHGARGQRDGARATRAAGGRESTDRRVRRPEPHHDRRLARAARARAAGTRSRSSASTTSRSADASTQG